MTDIRSAVEMGCLTMGQVFNADDKDIPYFGALALPEAELYFHRLHSEGHVPGRHLNALLVAEAYLGLTIDEEAVRRHAAAAFFSYSGPVALPLNREIMKGPLKNFAPHNLREGFHALYALTKFRNSDRARELAEASIATINQLWTPQAGWDRKRLEGEFGLTLYDYKSEFIGGLARALGPLVKYYQATKHKPALELATALRGKLVQEYLLEDGDYHPNLGTHTHSLTCVMSSLAQYAELTGDSIAMRRVELFFNDGLKLVSNELGWSLENAVGHSNPDRGEANNTGDILETALILARSGRPDYYHRAERILRGHLLPSQLRDVAFIAEPANPEKLDGKTRMAARLKGAFGFPAPYGHIPQNYVKISFNMDIVGGAVASLCEAWRDASHFDDAGHLVNLLLDHESDKIQVASSYGVVIGNKPHVTVKVRAKVPAPLAVRIPPWVDRRGIQVHGARHEVSPDKPYLLISEPGTGEVSIWYPLVTEMLSLKHRTRDIRVQMSGDAVAAMENFGTDLTFFPGLN